MNANIFKCLNTKVEYLLKSFIIITLILAQIVLTENISPAVTVAP